jgi:ribonuclease HII
MKEGMQGGIGIDEVGRGPLAGPVTVCAVYIEDIETLGRDIFQNRIRDSKTIQKSLRYNIYQTFRNKRYLNCKVEFAIHSRSATFIDKYGISKAIKGCVRSCTRTLRQKGVPLESVLIRLDAGLKVQDPVVNQQSFIKGDENYAEIALASILAKEHRDAYMKSLARRHKGYAWETNVGYGTKAHREAIKKLGYTKHHRVSYLKDFELLEK